MWYSFAGFYCAVSALVAVEGQIMSQDRVISPWTFVSIVSFAVLMVAGLGVFLAVILFGVSFKSIAMETTPLVATGLWQYFKRIFR